MPPEPYPFSVQVHYGPTAALPNSNILSDQTTQCPKARRGLCRQIVEFIVKSRGKREPRAGPRARASGFGPRARGTGPGPGARVRGPRPRHRDPGPRPEARARGPGARGPGPGCVNYSIHGPPTPPTQNSPIWLPTAPGPQTSDSSGPFHENSTRGEVGGPKSDRFAAISGFGPCML